MNIHDLLNWQFEDMPDGNSYRLMILNKGDIELHLFLIIESETSICYGVTFNRDDHEADLIVRNCRSLNVAMQWFEDNMQKVLAIGLNLYMLEGR